MMKRTIAICLGSLQIAFSMLQAQNIGGETTDSPLTPMEEDAYALPEITVTAPKIPVEMKDGKTVYNLSATVSGTQGSLYDALRQMPGIQVQGNGNILLDGREGIQVLINGKATYLTGEALANYLRSIPASTIEKIEVMNTPPAHLDAAGKTGMINIESRKIRAKGMVAGGTAGYSQTDRYPSGNGNVYLNLRKNRYNLYTDYAYHQGTDLNRTDIFRQYLRPHSLQAQNFRLRQQAHRTYTYGAHHLRIATSYDPTAHVCLNAYVNLNRVGRLEKEQLASAFYSHTERLDSATAARNRRKIGQQNWTGGIGATYQATDKLKGDAAFDFQRYHHRNGQNQYSRSLPDDSPKADREQQLRGDHQGDIRIYCGQTNQTFRFSPQATLGIGGKATFVTIDNAATYFNKVAEEWQEVLSLNHRFIYHENIHAGYLALNATPGRGWKMKAGLRVEHTRTSGRVAGNALHADSSFTSRYTHLFPFLQMQYRWGEAHQLSVLYSKRIVRPSYRDLSPFVTVNDHYLYEQGNTRLKPELAHNAELSYTLKSRYRITLLTSYARHPIAKSYIAEENKRIVVLPLNLSSNHSAGIRLDATRLSPFSWWLMNAHLQLAYREYSWQMDGGAYRNKRLCPMIHLGHRLHLPQEWSAEVNGYWNGKTPQGQAVVSAFWTLSVGISKRLWKDRATWRLFAENLLSAKHLHIEVLSRTQQGWYKEKSFMKLGVSLSFGLQKGEKTKEFTPQSGINESKRINL